ncbi:hypothetical protein Nepgr_021029 [Nepenthes gracilis]|uniref:Uncharacterized protein n=1 Tax=Nepenthes gracilis TaxID=150966 RepID=A0AAD3SW60_NEPGR|nr:hypothetical protein Nepgr_021029 [Nepenthes gracilis]
MKSNTPQHLQPIEILSDLSERWEEWGTKGKRGRGGKPESGWCGALLTWPDCLLCRFAVIARYSVVEGMALLTWPVSPWFPAGGFLPGLLYMPVSVYA